MATPPTLIRLSSRDRALIGQRVGDYLVGTLIGTGATSVVFEARHVETGAMAAIKVLLADRLSKRKNVDRFFDEAKMIRSVRHPGLVEIIDCGQLQDGRVYILMELLIGQSLQERIESMSQRGRRMPVQMALRLTRQIASAMEGVHKQGIAHRDLKPENIIIIPQARADGGEQAKVLDFGIAKYLEMSGERRTTMGMVLGSPSYMSPEQCRGAEPTVKLDVYSLGILLYEMLASKPPFFGNDPVAIMTAHLGAPPPPLSDIRPDVPRSVWNLCLELLAKDPADRPTMAEIREQIDALFVPSSRGSANNSSDTPRTSSQKKGVTSLLASGRNLLEFIQPHREALIAMLVGGVLLLILWWFVR